MYENLVWFKPCGQILQLINCIWDECNFTLSVELEKAIRWNCRPTEYQASHVLPMDKKLDSFNAWCLRSVLEVAFIPVDASIYRTEIAQLATIMMPTLSLPGRLLILFKLRLAGEHYAWKWTSLQMIVRNSMIVVEPLGLFYYEGPEIYKFHVQSSLGLKMEWLDAA